MFQVVHIVPTSRGPKVFGVAEYDGKPEAVQHARQAALTLLGGGHLEVRDSSGKTVHSTLDSRADQPAASVADLDTAPDPEVAVVSEESPEKK
jgi:hypothetical protein